MRDLVVLVADKKMEAGVRTLLQRENSLGIRPISKDVYRHPRHDPGVLREAHEFLRVFGNTHLRALVMFDWEGCGREPEVAGVLEAEVQGRLDATGWADRSGVVVLDPELEVWVWSTSPHVARVLGMLPAKLQEIVTTNTQPGAHKPTRPKELVRDVLRQTRVPWSASLYAALADQVGFATCTDGAFQRLRQLLQGWFPV